MKKTPTEIRELGHAWPPPGCSETMYADGDGRIDLLRCLEGLKGSLKFVEGEARAARNLAGQAANVSLLDYEDFRDDARDFEARAQELRSAVALVEKILKG